MPAGPADDPGPTLDAGRYDAALFDMDGVVTDTASVHAAAWRRLFDDVLAGLPAPDPADAQDGWDRPFTDDDYRRYVDGKAREDGVADFLASRGVRLPAGSPKVDEDAPTVAGLARRKDRAFRAALAADGVRAFDSTVALVRRLQQEGLRTAVFSASRNCREVLDAAGLGDLFAVRADGVVAAELALPGKPDPALLLEAARRLGAEPGRALVVEDSEAGVQAASRGGFGLVIGVDRTGGPPERLLRSGADLVVRDLSELRVLPSGRTPGAAPAAATPTTEPRR